MEGFIDEKEDFVFNTGLYLEPVEVNEGRVDVLPGLSVGENPGSEVLCILKSVQDVVWYAGQDSITVIQVEGDV